MDEFAYIKEFKKKIVKGASTLFLVKLILLPINILVSIILARVLEPVHFGIYGILNSLVYIGYQVSDLGLGAFLVQGGKKPGLDEYKTVFTLRLIFSVILFAIIWIIFPFIRSFFHLSAQAYSMIKVFSLILLAEPFSSVSRAILQRGLLYKRIGILDVINALSYYFVVLALALYRFGVWSFIIASVLSTFVTSLSYFVASPWSLGLKLNKVIAKKALRFGSLFQFSCMTSMLRDSIIAIFGGMAFGPQAVGYLSWAYGVTAKLSTAFSNEIGRITFPAISRIQSNAEAVSVFFSKATRYLMLFTAPIMFILFALSYEVIVLVFKPKWIPALPALIAFGLLALIGHFVTVGGSLLKGLGKVKKDFLIMSVWTVATWLIALTTAKWLGHNAIAIGWSLSALIPALWIINIVNRYHPLDLKGILNPLLAAALSAFLISLIKNIITANIYTLIILFGIGLFVYIFFLFVIERNRAWREVWDLLRLLGFPRK